MTILTLALGAFLLGQSSGPEKPIIQNKKAVPSSATTTSDPGTTKSAQAIEDKWGVRVEVVQLTAATMMVDVRLRVLDPEKADSLFGHSNLPVLFNPRTGHTLQVPNTPTMGRLRPTAKPEANRVYPIIFGNSLRELSTGDSVTLRIGEFEAANLVIE